MMSHTGCPLPIRKNACLVCSVCFTCSKTYGLDCNCDNIQPRRGKNLPGGSLDSRAKKLHATADKEDYEFSIRWLTENAHSIYKDDHDQVVGLSLADEVSLCKAHSSTLYRAKKRHERRLSQQAPPSPADSNLDYLPDTRRSSNSNNNNNNNNNNESTTGGLAAKVRELQKRYPPNCYRPSSSGPLPDFTTMSASTSMKRKRTTHHHHHHWRQSSSSPPPPPPPLSSASTPLFRSNPNMGYSGLGSASTLHPNLHEHSHPHRTSPIDPFTSQQLPPLQMTQPSIYHQGPSHRLPSNNSSSLFMAFQQQACISPSSSCTYHDSQPNRIIVETISLKTDRQQSIRPVMTDSSRRQEEMMDSPPTSLQHIIFSSYPSSTSSSSSSSSSSHSSSSFNSFYFIRNLAITDTFTFHQLLEEIEMERPPPGKRIVISNTTNDTFYPLNEPIRSVLRDPQSTHVELCLGLCDKPSFDWSSLPS